MLILKPQICQQLAPGATEDNSLKDFLLKIVAELRQDTLMEDTFPQLWILLNSIQKYVIPNCQPGNKGNQ